RRAGRSWTATRAWRNIERSTGSAWACGRRSEAVVLVRFQVALDAIPTRHRLRQERDSRAQALVRLGAAEAQEPLPRGARPRAAPAPPPRAPRGPLGGVTPRGGARGPPPPGSPPTRGGGRKPPPPASAP